ncbi:helix-turn-helix domain-containing protein [Mesorhizobium sp. A556]
MGKELFQTNVGLRSYDRAHVSTPLSLPDVYSDHEGFGALRQPPQRKPIEFDVPPLLDHVVIIYLNSPKSFGAAVGGGPTRPLSPRHGYVSVVPAESDSRWYSCSGDVDCLHLHLSPNRLEQLLGSDTIEGRAVELVPNLLAPDRVLASMGHRFAEELRQTQLGINAMMDSFALAVGVRLLRAYSSTYNALPNTDHVIAPYRLRRTVDFIEAHLGEDIGLAEIAAAAGLSAFHFSRGFKTAVGCSPYQFLIRRRIDKAQELLAGDDLTISQIALICGFSSQQHLTSTFARHVQDTPSRVRRALLGSDPKLDVPNDRAE